MPSQLDDDGPGEAAPAPEESAGAGDASMAGAPPGLEQQGGDAGDAGEASPQHIAAKEEEVPHDMEEDVLNFQGLLKNFKDLSEKLDQKDKDSAHFKALSEELASKVNTIESQMHYNGSPWWPGTDMGQYGWEHGWGSSSSASWHGQSSSCNNRGGRGGRGNSGRSWCQDSGGGGRGRSRDRERDVAESDERRRGPGQYKAEAMESSKAASQYRPCSLAYHSETTGDDPAFIDNPTQQCRHCQVINWAARSPDGPPKYGEPFPFVVLEQADFNNYLTNIARTVKDWSCASTRAQSFGVSLWSKNYLTDMDNNNLWNRLKTKNLLWRPALLSDPEWKGEQGWLCIWYKDTKNVTLFCRHCKRSSGFVRCDKERDKITEIRRGSEDRDDEEYPVLAGSNLDHQRYLRALLTNVTGVMWQDDRER